MRVLRFGAVLLAVFIATFVGVDAVPEANAQGGPVPPKIVRSGFYEKDGYSGRQVSYALIAENPNPNYYVEPVAVNIYFYDAGGTLVASATEYMAIMGPAQKFAAVGSTSLPPGSRAVRMEVAYEGRWYTSATLAYPTVDGATYKPDRYLPKAFGTVASPYSRAVRDLRVVAVAFGANGSVVGGGETWLGYLPPNGKAIAETSVSTSGAVAWVEMFPVFSSITKFE